MGGVIILFVAGNGQQVAQPTTAKPLLKKYVITTIDIYESIYYITQQMLGSIDQSTGL